jgi:MraZ protein
VIGFCGQFKVNLDPKGRISLPSKIRPRNDGGLPERLILTQGLDGCLTLYTSEEWSNFQTRLDGLSVTNRDFRFVSRFIYSSASIVEPDKQGRFLIPGNLLAEADLKRDALVVGAYRWIEIWNPERYKQFLDQHGGALSEVADRLFTNDGSGSE